MQNAIDGTNALLYKTDDFGSIKNSERGIEVTENFSHTTTTIALMLADKALKHQPLIINGSPDFHKALLQVALENNLSIFISKRPKSQAHIHPARAKTIEEATKTGFHLPSVHGTAEGIKLSEDKARDLDEPMREQYQRVRYDFSDEQKS